VSGTDATRCKVCGGPFAAKRIVIEGEQYHERCALMSYPPHTHEDYARLSNQLAEAVRLLDALLGLELGSGERATAFLATVSAPTESK
jgi:hypothetical protein